MTEPEPKRKILEDGDKNLANWVVSDGATVNRILQKERNKNNIVEFQTTGRNLTQLIPLI